MDSWQANPPPQRMSNFRKECPTSIERVKREIFGVLAKSVVSTAVSAGGVFRRKAGGGGGSSSITTTPTSGYTSDQNSESS
ncbi:unnamed protein product [Thlaspi arvense]|uniref:Uncharacterized protein n=1 Tax=Thlaspi arvense TaxID=13288 RepID=A0AAU9T7W6_THLAR|nr:unnamed protein product [Thlaspi arvense]